MSVSHTFESKEVMLIFFDLILAFFGPDVPKVLDLKTCLKSADLLVKLNIK